MCILQAVLGVELYNNSRRNPLVATHFAHTLTEGTACSDMEDAVENVQ